MNNIFKKVLMSVLLVSLVLCVPTFAEEVSEKEASFDIEKEIEEAEKDFAELIEMEGPEAENKIKNETYESEEREVVVEPKEEIEPKEELASVEPETEVETEALELDAFEPTDFEPVEAETETIETEIFEPTAEPIEESISEYDIEPEEELDTEGEALVESEIEVEKESETTKEGIGETETVAETTVEPTTETETETTTETTTTVEITVEVATESTLDKDIVSEDLDDTVATISEVADGKCEVVVYWLTDMKLKEQGNGGSYNYSWDKFLIDKGSEFAINENIPCVIKHSSCEQEYTLIGFTTENQKDNYWKGADYAGGDATLDKNFVVDGDMEIFAVYEAKDTYISSIIIDNEVTYKTTTIPNKAIKNIRIIDDNNENDAKVVCIENVNYYKIKNNLDDVNYMFTKDASKGAPIKACDFSLEKYK